MEENDTRLGLPAVAGEASVLRGVLAPDLRVLFVAFEPGPTDIRLGHHHARRNNQFWRLLKEAGLTPRQLAPEEDRRLPEWGLGLLSAVRRRVPGSGADAGGIGTVAPRLAELMRQQPPAILAYTGKGVYLRAAGLGSAGWGRQPGSLFAGVPDFVLPSPSGKVRMTFDAKLRHYRDLARLAEQLHTG